MREERRLRIFKTKVLKRITECKREKRQEVVENYTVRSFVMCTLHHTYYIHYFIPYFIIDRIKTDKIN
jgi:hypothetical protein